MSLQCFTGSLHPKLLMCALFLFKIFGSPAFYNQDSSSNCPLSLNLISFQFSFKFLRQFFFILRLPDLTLTQTSTIRLPFLSYTIEYLKVFLLSLGWMPECLSFMPELFLLGMREAPVLRRTIRSSPKKKQNLQLPSGFFSLKFNPTNHEPQRRYPCYLCKNNHG